MTSLNKDKGCNNCRITYILSIKNFYQFTRINYVNILFQIQDALPNPQIRGLDEPILVGRIAQIVCHTQYFWSKVPNFTWLFHKKSVSSHVLAVLKHDNNTASFTSALDYTFSRSDDQQNLTCTVVIDDNISASHSVSIDLQCEFCTTYSKIISARMCDINIYFYIDLTNIYLMNTLCLYGSGHGTAAVLLPGFAINW